MLETSVGVSTLILSWSPHSWTLRNPVHEHQLNSSYTSGAERLCPDSMSCLQSQLLPGADVTLHLQSWKRNHSVGPPTGSVAGGKEHRPWGQVSTPPLSCGVTLGKFLTIWEPQLPPLSTGHSGWAGLESSPGSDLT